MRRINRMAVVTLAASGLAIAPPALAQIAATHGSAVFISPMGEPFRGASAKLMLRAWFDGADANHDGSVTLAEMQADAARLFASLNRNHDSEIDPGELTTYESETAPEVRVGSTVLDRGDFAYQGGGASASSADKQVEPPKPKEPLKGAGRYGLLATPNPVASADANFNRGISADEFARAARTRFGLLDANHDGRLGLDELPALPSRYDR